MDGLVGCTIIEGAIGGHHREAIGVFGTQLVGGRSILPYQRGYHVCTQPFPASAWYQSQVSDSLHKPCLQLSGLEFGNLVGISCQALFSCLATEAGYVNDNVHIITKNPIRFPTSIRSAADSRCMGTS
jgi:hypothetical protein